MKKYLLILVSLVGVVAAPIILHDGTNVVGFLGRANTQQWTNKPNSLIAATTNQWLEGVTNYTVLTNFSWPGQYKIVGRTNVVAKTQQEIDTEASIAQSNVVAQAEVILRNLASNNITNLTPEGLAFRAVMSVAIDEINALRGQLNQIKTNNNAWLLTPTLNNRTMNQAKNSALNKISDKSVD